jgi:membrane protease YdiL (CAAX protease family)
MGKLTAFDYAVLAVLVVGPLFEWLWYWPRCVQATQARVSGARLRFYRNTVIAEWIVTLSVLGLWEEKGRPWGALWFGTSSHLRLAFGLAFAGVIIGLLWLQSAKILARPKAIAHVREKITFADPLVPSTIGERHVFWLVSTTAGICEEIVYRGFVIWCLATWTDLILAVIISSIIFGFGHVYLGFNQVPRTAVFGLVLALIVVASGSLWPAIAIHAALDMNSGELGFRVRQVALPASGAAQPFTS